MNILSIRAYLDSKGLDCSLDGYRYLIDLIQYAYFHPSAKLDEVSSVVALKYRVNAECIRGNVRYLLRNSSDSNCTSKLKNFLRTAVYDLAEIAP